jgi:hypothetical protein
MAPRFSSDATIDAFHASYSKALPRTAAAQRALVEHAYDLERDFSGIIEPQTTTESKTDLRAASRSSGFTTALWRRFCGHTVSLAILRDFPFGTRFP